MTPIHNKPGVAFWAIVVVVAGMVAVGVGFRLHQAPDSSHLQPAESSPISDSRYVQFAGTAAVELRDNNSIKMNFIWCPPGQFMMGGPVSQFGQIPSQDKVAVTITSGFWIGRTEVTQEQWQAIMGTAPWKGQKWVDEGSDYAASHLSWDDATEFCSKFTLLERQAGRLPPGWVYDLPTEAEWEYACRAGTTTNFSFGDDAQSLGMFAWFQKNAGGIAEKYAHPVQQKQANAWWLHDMHGNVFEWCQDVYVRTVPGGIDPLVDTPGSDRVYRGGCWNFPADSCRSAYRSRYDPTFSHIYIGFRVACRSSRDKTRVE